MYFEDFPANFFSNKCLLALETSDTVILYIQEGLLCFVVQISFVRFPKETQPLTNFKSTFEQKIAP